MSNVGGFGRFNGGPSKNYVNISNGKLVVRCKDGDEGAVARKLTKGKNEGKLVYEQLYDFFTGHITNVGIVKNVGMADSLHIHVTNREAKHSVIITMQFDSDNAARFYKVMKNIDLTRPVMFRGYNFVPEGQTKAMVGYNLFQGDEKLTSYWTKEEIPQWTKSLQAVQGKLEKQEVWDKSPSFTFYLEHLNKWIRKNSLEIPEGSKAPNEDEEDEAPTSGFGNQQSQGKAGGKKYADLDDDEIDF
jgi:hypothetical protein